MPAPTATLNADKPVLLPVGQELLRDALRARGLSVTALAATLGISRKHLSNVLNGRASLVEPLAHRLAEAADVDPVLLGAAIRVPRRVPLARHGAMKGWIVAHGDLTEPMEGWEMLED
jgi:transcriptional regulator with XRE-family HTH domain